jgi:hypothetical protein
VANAQIKNSFELTRDGLNVRGYKANLAQSQPHVLSPSRANY